MKNHLLSICTLLVLLTSSCAQDEMLEKRNQLLASNVEFLATFEDMPDSRTYIEEDEATSNLYLRWTKGDEISIFRGTTLNQRFQFKGETGDNSGSFKSVPSDDFVSSNDLNERRNYAFYPYDEDTKITEKGMLTVTLPEVQTYAENSFGLGANGMVAVTESTGDVDLKFKNIGGYFKFKFYGDVTIKSVTLKGNNGEKLAGKASVAGGYGTAPVVTMSEEATETLTLDCGTGIKVGNTKETATEFWFVLPPTKFEKGFTITVTDTDDGIFTKTTEKLFEIKRNTIKPISAMKVETVVDWEAIYAKERAALIDLYHAVDGENVSSMKYWCSDRPVSEWWGGIGTNEKGRVSSLTLISLPSGSLPESIGDLTNLEKLYISNCNLTGSIPESIGNLSSLKTLSLNRSKLNGSIPESIGNLTELTSLEITYNNQLSGNIPESIGYLTNLEDLNLIGNKLTGNIPPSVSNLKSLKQLNLSGNQLSGGIPEGIGNLTNLQILSLGNNSLGGNIPEWIGNLTNLEKLWMSKNQLSGNIPESIGRLPKLTMVDFQYNQLSGTIPESITKAQVWKNSWPSIIYGNQFNLEGVYIPAPDFNLTDLDGNTISSETEYTNNKLTILYLWASWCGFSQDFNETIIHLYDFYKNKGLEIIGRCDYNARVEQEYIKEHNIPWRNYWQQDGIMLFRNIYSIPNVVAIDDKRKVVFQSFTQSRSDLAEFVKNYFSSQSTEDLYTSTDYSKDGEVITLQQATVGQGINLTLLGEAFVDKDMGEGGLYEQKMTEAMENLFSIEPYKSMRNRFNVYAVKVVSSNAEFVDGAKHRIDMNDDVCFEYAQKIPNPNLNPPMITVVYNTWHEVGRSRCRMRSDGSFISFIMNVDVAGSIMLHETGGHGFGQLLDEYVEPGNEYKTLPEENKRDLDDGWVLYGQGANVDWRNDASTVKWSKFLKDSRYANEGLGLYEGSFLYGKGAYRPTENSMMRHNDSPFNAPSREQIYKRIMQLSEGADWKYDYEKFVEYDAINRNAASRSVSRTLTEAEKKEYAKKHCPPTFINGTWRDAMNNGKQNIIVPLR